MGVVLLIVQSVFYLIDSIMTLGTIPCLWRENISQEKVDEIKRIGLCQVFAYLDNNKFRYEFK